MNTDVPLSWQYLHLHLHLRPAAPSQWPYRWVISSVAFLATYATNSDEEVTSMEGMFYNGWFALLRTTVVGILAYAGLVVFLRLSGKRTLAKMNAFDLIVTVSLGSTLATIALSADVALAQGLLALALLVSLQFVITWSSVRWRWVRRTITGEPSLLLFRGEYLQVALHRARVTEEEVRAAVRSRGLPAVEDVEAVVLETDGSFSVIGRANRHPPSSLTGIEMPSQNNPGT